MNEEIYPSPVNQLLTIGEPEAVDADNWPDYLVLGIQPEHVPDLLRILADEKLRTSNLDETNPNTWAGIHAWRALGQLHAINAIEPLLALMSNLLDDDSGFGDWAIEELSEVYGLMGPTIIPALTSYIADTAQAYMPRAIASNGLVTIANMHPEARESVIAAIVHQLEQYEVNDLELNAALIDDLCHLKAVETLPLIEQAFKADRVDEDFIGLDDALVEFGLKEREPMPTMESFLASLQNTATELPDFHHVIDSTPPSYTTPHESYWKMPITTSGSHHNKKKKKEKITKASQKKNRRKK